MEYVYMLIHNHLVEDNNIFDTKLIGFYSTKEKAQEVIKRYKTIEGFRDYPEGFIIEECEIDETDVEFV